MYSVAKIAAALFMLLVLVVEILFKLALMGGALYLLWLAIHVFARVG
jgi:threonine/homoserine/homoserine lactone efflux protein